MRAWTRGLFTGLAREAGAADPDDLAGQLVLLYDGATVGTSMDRGPRAARQARTMAEALLDAQAPSQRKKGAPAGRKRSG
jgi:hypothetical protein